MKKKRNLTFGYCISNGRIVFCEKESETVRKIFDLYLSGQPLGKIAELLTHQKVPYSDMTSEWNKSRVSRILSTEKYVGWNVYPQIISEKDFNTANSIKSSRKGAPRTDIKLFCSECGKRMRSVNTRGKLPIEFIKERTEKVCLDRDGCITMRMTTGADISERSHIYGSHKNTEKNGHSD